MREPSPDAAAGLPLASAAFKGAPAAAAPGDVGPGFSPTLEAAQDPPLNSRVRVWPALHMAGATGHLQGD